MIFKKKPFKLGDCVRFKDGQKDEASGLDIGGWQGRIIEINGNQKMLMVALDSITLKSLPRGYLEDSEAEGLGWSEYYIEFDSVEPAQPRDTEKDVKETIADLDERYGILVKVKKGGRLYIFPLSDLEVVAHNSPNHDPVQLYAVWYANR